MIINDKPYTLQSFMLYHSNKILIIAPHIDDEAIGCGGIILKSLAAGKSVDIIYLTGDMERTKEGIHTWKPYNVKLTFLNYSDCSLSKNISEVSDKVMDYIKDHEINHVFIPWLLDTHPDHFVASRILNVRELKGDFLICFYEIFYPLYSNYSIDITDLFDAKMELLDNFTSQRKLHLQEKCQLLNAFRAKCIGINRMKYVEAFCAVNALDYDRLCKWFI